MYTQRKNIKTEEFRIEGNYAIVSVFNPDHSWSVNDTVHRTVVDMLLRKGFRVQELSQFENGTERRAIRIEGVSHAAEARYIAATYDQDFYMLIANGEAVTKTWSPVHKDYIGTHVALSMTVVEGSDLYYSVQGLRFAFV